MKVVTIANGEIPYKKVSVELLTKYFNKKDIEFIVLEENKFNYNNVHPSWWKCHVHKLFDDDFIVTWDLDMIPVNFEYDLNTIFDKSKLNMTYDSGTIFDKTYFNQNFKYNCGFMGIPKCESGFIEKVYDKHSLGWYGSWEQYYVNDEIVFQNKDVNLIPFEYNFLYLPRFYEMNLKNIINKYDIKNFHFTYGIPYTEYKKTLIEQIKEIYYENF